LKETRVVIVRDGDPKEMVHRALKLMEAERLVSPEDKVLLKPNYVVARSPDTGVTTDSRVIEASIEFLKGLKIKEIVVGEGGAGDTERAFDAVGIREVVKRQGVKLLDLNRDERVNVRILGAMSLKEVGIAKTALESTCIFNLPKLKIHHMALVTLCMKNLMGFILPKSIIHEDLNEKIVDLASLIKPKINLIDGIVGAELDETKGNPVPMNLLIAGSDMVAVDAVATAVMGVNPKKVRYLQLAEERRLGIANLERIEVIGEQIEDVQKSFKLPPAFKDAAIGT